MSSSVSRKMFNADGCSRCPVGDVNLFESEPYITKQTGVWPETNPFFIDSIYHLINRNTKLSEGVLFVDFSRDNIAYFINEDWMAGLKNEDAYRAGHRSFHETDRPILVCQVS